MLASRLGYRFIDTGIMYRALTWAVIRDGIDTDNEAAVTALAQHTKIYISGNDGKEDQLISVDDQDVTKMLRTSEIERGVSQISRFTGVRQAMVALQRILAKDGMLIMAGRDIGTVVLPDADLKIFLTASSEERARRRHNDMKDASQAPALEQVMDELLNRDKLDTERTNSPLRPADGAHILNTESWHRL
jgi:cytidylate kinase